MSGPSLSLEMDGVELITLAQQHVAELATLRVANAEDIRRTAATLHRLQARVQPMNVASKKSFLRNDFEQIGLARGYLFVDGAWRDHLLFQRLANQLNPNK